MPMQFPDVGDKNYGDGFLNFSFVWLVHFLDSDWSRKIFLKSVKVTKKTAAMIVNRLHWYLGDMRKIRKMKLKKLKIKDSKKQKIFPKGNWFSEKVDAVDSPKIFRYVKMNEKILEAQKDNCFKDYGARRLQPRFASYGFNKGIIQVRSVNSPKSQSIDRKI